MVSVIFETHSWSLDIIVNSFDFVIRCISPRYTSSFFDVPTIVMPAETIGYSQLKIFLFYIYSIHTIVFQSFINYFLGSDFGARYHIAPLEEINRSSYWISWMVIANGYTSKHSRSSFMIIKAECMISSKHIVRNVYTCIGIQPISRVGATRFSYIYPRTRGGGYGGIGGL